MLAIVARNDIPDFELRIEAGRVEPGIRMIRKSQAPAAGAASQKGRAGAKPPVFPPPGTRLPPLSEQTIGMVRRDFPGLDVYAIKAEYDAWLTGNTSRMPHDYQKGYYGFVRHVHTRYHA
jgi:hypothetical protein